ncbi:MAG: glycosyltransferase [Chloroflexi bacterium]|nr:glycosyltransferase [Chloroflexota bacterium]
MREPLVDVILPVYNGERWLREAIESVLRQSYSRWHLTIVDDASPDRSAELAEAYQRLYPDKITLVRLGANRRAAGARMEGIRRTQGEIIALLDQDDRWRRDYLAKQVHRLTEDHDIQAAHADITVIDEAGREIQGAAVLENGRRARFAWERAGRKELMRFLCHSPLRNSAVAVWRAALLASGGFAEDLFGGEDWEFWIRFANTWRIGHIAEPLVEWRLHAINTSSTHITKRISGWMEATRRVAEAYPFLAGACTSRRHQALRRVVRLELTRGQISDARRHVWRLVREVPLDPRTWWLGVSALLGDRTLGRWLVQGYAAFRHYLLGKRTVSDWRPSGSTRDSGVTR